MLVFKQLYGKDGYEKARSLREEVFMGEQGVSFDYDEFDDISWHIVGYDGDTLISTARVYKMSDTAWKLGRVAVKKEYRRGYVGDLMMKTLQDKIVSLGGIEAVVSAQLSAKGFYEKEGYTAKGEPYDEAGSLHILMTMDLSKPQKRCCCKGE